MGKITRDDFIKIGNRYLLKDSNSIYVDEAGMNVIILKNINEKSEEERNETKKVVIDNDTKRTKNNTIKKTTTIKK